MRIDSTLDSRQRDTDYLPNDCQEHTHSLYSSRASLAHVGQVSWLLKKHYQSNVKLLVGLAFANFISDSGSNHQNYQSESECYRVPYRPTFRMHPPVYRIQAGRIGTRRILSSQKDQPGAHFALAGVTMDGSKYNSALVGLAEKSVALVADILVECS